MVTGCYFTTGKAFSARYRRLCLSLAEDEPCKVGGYRLFPDTRRPDEKIRPGDSAGCNGALELLNDVFVSDDVLHFR